MTGGLRIGVSARLAKSAAASIGNQPPGEADRLETLEAMLAKMGAGRA